MEIPGNIPQMPAGRGMSFRGEREGIGPIYHLRVAVSPPSSPNGQRP